jgi:hypothetical protein
MPRANTRDGVRARNLATAEQSMSEPTARRHPSRGAALFLCFARVDAELALDREVAAAGPTGESRKVIGGESHQGIVPVTLQRQKAPITCALEWHHLV